MTAYRRVTEFLRDAGAVRVPGERAGGETIWAYGQTVLLLRRSPEGVLELFTLLTRSSSPDAVMGAITGLRMEAPTGRGPSAG